MKKMMKRGKPRKKLKHRPRKRSVFCAGVRVSRNIGVVGAKCAHSSPKRFIIDSHENPNRMCI